MTRARETTGRGGGAAAEPAYDVVVPSTRREPLVRMLAALAAGDGPPPERIVIVDDRRGGREPLLAPAGGGLSAPLADRIVVLRGGGRGPAAARNAGWRAARADWVAFLDDDVVPEPGWRAALARDLAALGADVAASQGRIRVPLPRGRRPTDWERNVAGLERARWATADMAYRRAALVAAGGFDERFPRAYREDADLGLRVAAAGWRIVRGERVALHPVGAADARVSLRLQAGNADDALMRRLHGPTWRERAGAPPGRRVRHVATSVAGGAALAALAARRRRLAGLALAGWLAGTGELARARIAPGPRTPGEVATMLWTSAAMPAAATWHAARGELRAALLARRPGPPVAEHPGPPVAEHPGPSVERPGPRAAERPGAAPAQPPLAVLLDRDGTLVRDVPYNADPDRVEPLPGVRDALDRLRAAGVRLAVVSNQSGIARGLIAPEQLEAVNRRVEDLLGPLGAWLVCPHGPGDRCRCRKPAPGLVLDAARALGVPPQRCAVVGDIGADVEAARAAGARGVLVPNERTRREEVLAAAEVAPSLGAAVDLLLGAAAPVPGGHPADAPAPPPPVVAPAGPPAARRPVALAAPGEAR